ncbi:RNA polymerase sigma-70 factor [Tamlana sp. 2201CG12-4]|uniref:RNA polymerase sigma factor n=1 Tax=Tamlana sp. 2201CG12-4 TaxID=3112582 RepID=UPI002DBF0A1A|nr:RNA polymerase sigma-70 factor [Tamlana sp. 2201CG12-4]MEC3908843.1 RNA polymerase sigma-70 factor [Tamlana sp. 2201CG12-4]
MLKNKRLIQDINVEDEKDFNKLYQEHYNALYIYLLRFTLDKKNVEDIVQDTFTHIWYKRKQISINTSFKSYLYKTAYYKLIDVHRLNIKNDRLLSSYNYVEHTLSSKINDDITEKHLESLEACISVLPPKCKDVFIAHKISGKKHKEVANEMGISIKTVENHITKAYKTLRNCMNNSCSSLNI